MRAMEIREDYTNWIAELERARSPELDFGVWWTLTPDAAPVRGIPFDDGVLISAELNARRRRVEAHAATRWRVSWIEDTGELYARDLAMNSERVIVLGRYPTRAAIEERMDGWAAGGAKALSKFFPEAFS
jgi:hypothetical protein